MKNTDGTNHWGRAGINPQRRQIAGNLSCHFIPEEDPECLRKVYNNTTTLFQPGSISFDEHTLAQYFSVI